MFNRTSTRSTDSDGLEWPHCVSPLRSCTLVLLYLLSSNGTIERESVIIIIIIIIGSLGNGVPRVKKN